VVAGCGKKSVPVSGKVTVDGRPLTNAIIFFAPDKDNPLRTIAKAKLGEDGTYQLTTNEEAGAPLGWYKVYVAFDSPKPTGKPRAAPVAISKKYLDASHSPLSVEVVANPPPGAYDFQLTNKGP
jgi:hypothetical protein